MKTDYCLISFKTWCHFYVNFFPALCLRELSVSTTLKSLISVAWVEVPRL